MRSYPALRPSDHISSPSAAHGLRSPLSPLVRLLRNQGWVAYLGAANAGVPLSLLVQKART